MKDDVASYADLDVLHPAVIFDANLWRSNWAFRTQVGRDLFRVIGETGARIAYTDVQSAEVRRAFEKECRTRKRQQQRSDSLATSPLKSWTCALDSQEQLCLRLPITSSLKVRAADRQIRKEYLCYKGIGDILLWESAKELSAHTPVVLVSRDRKAFCAKGEQFLHPNLSDEVAQINGRLRFFSDIRPLLDYLTIILGEKESKLMTKLAKEGVRSHVERYCREKGIRLSPEGTGQERLSKYRTEYANLSCVTYACCFSGSIGKDAAIVKAEGVFTNSDVDGSLRLRALAIAANRRSGDGVEQIGNWSLPMRMTRPRGYSWVIEHV